MSRTEPISKIDVAAFDTSVFLDEILPLRGASHADVIRYAIEIPMRYAECFGILDDGRRVPLLDGRQFTAWSGHEARRSILFDTSEMQIEIQVDPDDQVGQHSPGHIVDVIHTPPVRKNRGSLKLLTGRCRAFIATDGSLLNLPG